MKKPILLLTFFLLFTGCVQYGKIKYNNDPFKKAITLTMLYKHSSIEKQDTFAGKFVTISTYYREIKSGVKSPAQITFKIAAMENFNSLKPDGFIRVNKKTYPLTMTDITSVLKTDINTKVSQTNDDTITSDRINLKTTTTSRTETSRWKSMTGTITIPENVEQEILKAKLFAFRFYIDTRPITFIIKRKDLATLKSFFGATEDYVPR